jgi:hypothetical protein
VFWDAGTASNSIKGVTIYNGVGVGARWRSPVGPVQLDVGYGIQQAVPSAYLIGSGVLMSIPDMPCPARETPNAPRPPRPRRRVWRVLAWIVGLLVFLVIAVIGAAAFALHNETGTRHLWGLATRLSAGMLAGQFDGGTVASGLRLHDVVYASGTRASRSTVSTADGR